MRVAVVENTARTPHGLVGVALAEASATIDIFRPYEDGALPDGPGTHDAIVVLGGNQSAVDDLHHPYLGRLAGLMRQFCDADRAVLGICLGSQLLARGYHGQNQIGIATEFGWHRVTATDDGLRDPVLSAVGHRDFDVFQWHDDTFTLPDGAVHLAQNTTAAHQAFRLGRAAYGMQFHFEAGSAVVQRWTDEFPDQTEDMHPGWIASHRAIIARHGPAADAAGLALARAWVGLIQA